MEAEWRNFSAKCGKIVFAICQDVKHYLIALFDGVPNATCEVNFRGRTTVSPSFIASANAHRWCTESTLLAILLVVAVLLL